MQYVEYRIGSLTVEIPMPKRKKQHPLKRLAQWGIGAFVKGQIGSLLGTLAASVFPTFAISGALLIASTALWIALAYPGTETIAPMILGLALGVLA